MRTKSYVLTAILAVVLVASLWWIVEGFQVTEKQYGARPVDAQIKAVAAAQALLALERSAPSPRDEVALANLLMLFRDATDVPLAGVQVTLVAHSGNVNGESRLTRADGKAAFEGIAAGMYFYALSAPARPILISLQPLRLAGGDTKSVELRISDYDRTISGRVLDRRGSPVDGLTLTAREYHARAGPTDTALRFESRHTARTGADGKFEITGLRDGEYQVSIGRNETYPPVMTTVRAGTESMVLYVTEGRMLRVSGRVTDPAGKPLAAVQVIATGHSGGITHSDSTGRYELTLHAEHTKNRQPIRFVLQGYRESSSTLQIQTLAELDEITADAALEPLGPHLAVFGIIKDRHGAPVAGERVQLESSALRTSYHGLSNTDGEFSFTAVAMSADYKLQVRPKGGYRDYMRQPLDLTVDASPLEIVLESLATGRLIGRMVGPQGNPVPHLRLWLRSNHAQGQTLELIGDANGNFALDRVPGREARHRHALHAAAAHQWHRDRCRRRAICRAGAGSRRSRGGRPGQRRAG